MSLILQGCLAQVPVHSKGRAEFSYYFACRPYDKKFSYGEFLPHVW